MNGDPNATHLEALLWTLRRTAGPILELGAGWYSTPLLAAADRLVVTVEGNRHWREWAALWDCPLHRTETPIDGLHPELDEEWGLVFVDHGDAARRAESVLRYRGSTIVVHDTQPEVAGSYPGLEEALQSFDHRRDFALLEPHTTVVYDSR